MSCKLWLPDGSRELRVVLKILKHRVSFPFDFHIVKPIDNNCWIITVYLLYYSPLVRYIDLPIYLAISAKKRKNQIFSKLSCFSYGRVFKTYPFTLPIQRTNTCFLKKQKSCVLITRVSLFFFSSTPNRRRRSFNCILSKQRSENTLN